VHVDFLVVVSDADPVARAVAREWGTLPATGERVDDSPIRELSDGVWLVRRPGRHVHDEGLDARLPEALRSQRPTLVFPSIHRSGRNIHSFTVHPLGNPGTSADLGGRPRTLVPTDPRRMASALRLLHEGAKGLSLSATYEATHHGPALGLPAFFVEIGYGELAEPPSEQVRLLREVIPQISVEPADRVALGVGGGHYAPHFSELTLERRWAFGHLLSRHALESLDGPTARTAFDQTPGAEGVVFARAQDASHSALQGLGPRLRDQDAPRRDVGSSSALTGDVRSASGT